MKISISLSDSQPDLSDLNAWCGHSRPRPDGMKAKCGGPDSILGCQRCALEKALLGYEAQRQEVETHDLNDMQFWCGHVRPRPDGATMRCGGPERCQTCLTEKRRLMNNQPNQQGKSMKLNIALSGSKKPYDLSNVGKKDRKRIGALFNGLREDAANALLTGESIPDFDLCSITVPGTNLFCQGNKGLPRSVMPQLKGFPVPGSPAESMPLEKSGKVDASQAFLDMLEEKGIKVRRYKILPAKLKATQNQLVGSKIAINAGKMESNPNHKKFKMPYFISKDGYILDGHHGWAAVMAHNLLNKTNTKISVIEVDLKIKKLVKLTNAFCQEIGIAPKSGETN